MSADRTPEEIIENLLYEKRRELNDLERGMKSLVKATTITDRDMALLKWIKSHRIVVTEKQYGSTVLDVPMEVLKILTLDLTATGDPNGLHVRILPTEGTEPVLHFHGPESCNGHDSVGDVPSSCPDA